MRGNVATWPHAPNTSVLGGLIPGNGSTFCTIFGTHVWAEFMHGKTLSAGLILPEVQYGEPVTELGERKNGSKHNLMSF
jgi:hypothetical protein